LLAFAPTTFLVNRSAKPTFFHHKTTVDAATTKTTMAITTPTITFPHEELTPIVGDPSSKDIILLKKEMYTNTRSVPSTLGGGAHGHLGMIMPAASYQALTGAAFVPPVHPGPRPVYPPGATQHQIAAIKETYYLELAAFTTFSNVQEELKKQILKAVPRAYLTELEDAVFGFADVSAAAMLAHMVTNFGTVTQEMIEDNRLLLSAEWDPTTPIHELWARTTQCQVFAADNAQPIVDAAAIGLIKAVIEKTGLFDNALDKWNDKDPAAQTLANFKTHFNAANKERLRKLKAQDAGYQEHARAATATKQVSPGGSVSSSFTTATNDANSVCLGGVKMYYCWTHGLGTNANHTSATCRFPKDGHKTDATANNMMGGNNTIMTGNPNRPRRRQRRNGTTPPGTTSSSPTAGAHAATTQTSTTADAGTSPNG